MTIKKLSYFEEAKLTKEKLEKISPTMCMAKWLQVSIHLPAGLTQSCYHPPVHTIPIIELKNNVKALHNTQEKFEQRKQMLNGERPAGCQYCWNIEDAPDGPHISDRHYRSSEDWTEGAWEEVLENDFNHNINPRYVEVNFNQACNFKCAYCSPHLSTAWEKENKEFGKFKMPNGGSFHDIEDLRARGHMPLPGKNSDNPYVQAFWEWWPEMYKTLRVFRMTGGEPLMDKNTFRVLDYVNEHPSSTVELSLTSNMCPPDPKLFDLFIEKVQKLEVIRVWEDTEKLNPTTGNHWYVNPACKHFTLFVSVDSTGNQAEYVRNGLDYNVMMNNVRRFLKETDGTVVSFINTFNLLSITRLKDFLQMILDLRIEFGFENQKINLKVPVDPNGGVHSPVDYYGKRQRIWFDIPYLRLPAWLSAQNAAFYPVLMEQMVEALKFMEENVEKSDYHTTYHGFKEYEIAKLKRDIAWMNQGTTQISEREINSRRASFWSFFDEADRRRGTSFINEFPEMTEWWDDCKRDNDNFV